MKKIFKIVPLTTLESILLLSSVAVITVSFFASQSTDYLTLIASLIGVTSLILNAKGLVLGQILMVFFSIIYGVISINFRYYGEMMTYLLMTAPIAIMTAIEWYKNPYKDTAEVTVSNVTKKQLITMSVLTVVVTVIFYFILDAFNTANMFFSTVSVATSFVAAYLTLLRSPYYAIGYMANDLVLIVLWTLATIENPKYFAVIICFVIFLINDFYGYYSWNKMRARQNS